MGTCHSNEELNLNKLSSLPRQDSVKSNQSNSDPNNFTPISSLTVKDDITKFYRFTENIKKGTFGAIREAFEFETGKRFAIKSIWKKQYNSDKISLLKQEIDLTLSLQHEHVMRCYEVFEDINSIHMVLELASNGDLLDYLLGSENNVISESKAALFISQILEALHYLHMNCVVHRDIKLENFLIFEENSKVKVKLIDFGFATKLKSKQDMLTEKLGSLPYMAPEIFNCDYYDQKVDIWACGIILYNMLTGRQPYYGESDSDLVDQIMNFEKVSFEKEIWNTISENAKDLIQCLLSKEPGDRPTAFQARQHCWFSSVFEQDETIKEVFVPKSWVVAEIAQSLGKHKDLKNEVWNLCVKYLEPQEAINIKEYLVSGYKKIENRNSLSNFIVNYDTFVRAILLFCGNTLLKISLEGEYKVFSFLDILKKKQCDKQRIDFNKFFEDFEKTKNAVKRVELWNLFKNIDKVKSKKIYIKSNTGKVHPSQIVETLKEKNIKIVIFSLNFQTISDTKMQKINFEKFVRLLDRTNSKIILDNDKNFSSKEL